jgi:hydrogenase-4 component E
MEQYSIILSTFILLTAFVLVAGKRIRSYINALRLQGILIALNTGLIGIEEIRRTGRFDVLAVGLIIVALKVVYIPRMLHRTYAGVEYKVEKDFSLNIPLMILICCGIVVFNYFTFTAAKVFASASQAVLVINAISVVLIGLFFIISRKKAIGQIVGLLVIENGLFVTAMYASNGMPFIVDMGIFIDLITAVIIMGIMVFKINTAFESIDTDQMNNLKG